MKAVLLHAYGGVDQLEYTDVPDPIAEPGEVLIKVLAASINPIDYKIREGAMQAAFPIQFPAILGRDVSGEIVALTPGVSRFKVGDRVMGFVNHTYAEYVRAHPDALTPIPDELDSVDAAALPLVTITGAQLIERGVEPSPGWTVLVTGAAGSVGRTAVFVVKQLRCRVIAGVKGSQKKGAQALAADAVVALDEDGELSSLPELDAIADTVNGDAVAKLIPKLKKSGRFATVLGMAEAAEKAGADVRKVFAQPDPVTLGRLAQDVREGRLLIPIARRMPLWEIREAHTAAQKGAGGKIVLIP